MDCVINFLKNRIEYEGTSKEMKAKDREVLEYFIRNHGIVLSSDQIFDAVWGFDSEVNDDKAAVRQAVLRIRTEFPPLKPYLITLRKIGYKLELPKNYRVVFESGDEDNVSNREPAEQVAAEMTAEEKLPTVLTRTEVPYADEGTAIHRGRDMEALETILRGKKAAVMISGFGGVGKTTVARMLYSRLADEFDSVGWVEYHGCLKDSLLASLTLYSKLDDRELRFQCICDRLKNDRSKKLLIIDNVDSDKVHGQDPQKDVFLSELSGWPNLTVVLTSRFDKLRGYRSYRLNYLTPEDCEDLFYYYYNEWEYEIPREDRNMRAEVRALIQLAGYHTYAIELLAKSAKYSGPLDEYLKNVREQGFRFPELNVQTDHRNAYANAAEQLKKLFDMSTRSKSELRMLWDFSVLPNLELSVKEVEQWLGYTVNDLDQLIREGWLMFRQGYSMHPLIKETMHMDLVNGKAPEGTMAHLIRQIVGGGFLLPAENHTFAEAKRKLDVTEHVLKLITVPKEEGFELVPENVERSLAEAYNSVGYFLSYTNTGRREAMTYLTRALELRRQLELSYPEREQIRDEVATSCDYLGYLLSDQEDRKKEAEELLLEALSIRKAMTEKNQERYLADIAWTLDNLGYLLSSLEERQEEAEDYLKEALKIRRKLEEMSPGNHDSEVGWTCNNLGQLLQADETRFEEAEEYFRIALDFSSERIHTVYSWEAADSAILWLNLATLLQRRFERWKEAEDLYRDALSLMADMERNQKGMYTVELLICYHNLMTFLKRFPETDLEQETLWSDMLEVTEELERMYPGVYGEFLGEITGKADHFYIQSGSRKQKVKAPALEQILTQ